MRPLLRSSKASSRSEAAVNAEIRHLVRLVLAPGASEQAETATAGGGSHPSEYAFASYLEGGLTGRSEESFERHVARCPSCAEELVIARRSGVGQLPADARRVWKIAAAVAVVLAGLVAALLAAGAIGDRLEAGVLAGMREAFGDRLRADGASLTLTGGPGVELAELQLTAGSTEVPLLAAPSARWNVDLGGLGQGRVTGALHLRSPIINIVREPSGEVNIDAILPRAKDGESLFARARRKAIRSVEIAGGTLRLIDRSSGARREVRMAAVDASLTGLDGEAPAHLDARAGVESTRHNLHLRGEIGPWGEGRDPAYRFEEVALDAVSVRSLPGIGSVMGGGLSFAGHLSSAGDTWAEISGRFAGGGDLRVVAGSIAGRNLVGDVLAPLLGSTEPGSRPPGLSALIAASETSFAELQSPVAIAGSRLDATDFQANGNGFAVAGRGSLDAGGRVEFRGELTVTSEAAHELLALAPGASELVNEEGEIAIPFSVAGTWPEVRVAADVDQLAARTVLRRTLARLLFAPLRMLRLPG